MNGAMIGSVCLSKVPHGGAVGRQWNPREVEHSGRSLGVSLVIGGVPLKGIVGLYPMISFSASWLVI